MSMDQPGTGQMPWDQSTMSPNWAEPPQKKGLSGGCMVLIVLGVVGGLLVLVCCGGLVWMGYYFQSAVSDDPEVIAKVTEGLLQIDIPEELEPGFSFDMKVPFSGESMMVWVVYMDEETKSTLVLGTFGGPFAGQDQDELWEQIQESMDESLEEQGLRHEDNVRDWERYEKEIEVRGEPVTFYFATGTDEESEAERIEVTGTVQGEEGPVMFLFSGDAEKYDEQAVVEIIESIR